MKNTQLLVAFAVLCLALVFPLVASSSLLENGATVVSNDDLRETRLRNLAETIAELKAEADAEGQSEDDTHVHAHRNLVQVHSEQSVREEEESDDSQQDSDSSNNSDNDEEKDTPPAPATEKDQPPRPTRGGDNPRPTDRTNGSNDQQGQVKQTRRNRRSRRSRKNRKNRKGRKGRKHRRSHKGRKGRKHRRSRKGHKGAGKVRRRSQGTRRSDLVALYRFESKKNPGRGLGGPGRNLKVFGKGIKVLKGKGVAKRGRGALFIPARSTAVPKTVDPKNPYANSFLARNSKGKPIRGLPKRDESFTIAAWFKVSSSKPGRFGVVSFGTPASNQANVLKVTSTGQAISSFKNGNSLKSNNTNDAQPQWHHAAVTWNKKTRVQKIYVDGKLTAKRKLTKAPSVAGMNGQFFLGLTSNGPESEQYSGLLDDVAIFRRALTKRQIRNVKKGRFHAYLDLFALRGCSTRIGRRNHGAGFVLGSDKDQISLNSTAEGRYGFQVKNAYECSIKCAQTADCKQSVFYADASKPDTSKAAALPANATPAQKARASAKARKSTSGSCYLMNKKYSTYEADKSATSTTCKKPSRRLRKRSAVLKFSPAAAAKRAAKRAARVAAGKAPELTKAERKAKEEAERKAEQAKKTEKEAKAAEAVRKAAADAASASAKVAEAKKILTAAEEKKRAEREEAKKQAAQVEAQRREQEKQKVLEEKLMVEAKRAAKVELKRKYNEKIDKLKEALDAKESALKQAKAQATHRQLVETKKAEAVISKLSKRLARLTKKLQQKEDDTKTLALAQKIKLAADKKAEEILQQAKKQAIEVKHKAKEQHRKRLRRKIAHRKRAARRAARRARKLAKIAKKTREIRKREQGKIDDQKRQARRAARKAKKAAKRRARRAAKKALERARKREARKARWAKMTPKERKQAKKAYKAKRKARKAAKKAKRAAKKAARKAKKAAAKARKMEKEADKKKSPKAKSKIAAKKAAAAAKKLGVTSSGGLKF